MKLGKEVSYLNTKVGKIKINLIGEDYVIIETGSGKCEIYNRKEYETLLNRNEKISKLLDKN